MTDNITDFRYMRENMNYFRFDSCGAALSAVVYMPTTNKKSPGIVLCHGLSNSRHVDPMIQDTANELQQKGFATMQFDFYGSGESDGFFQDKSWSILKQNARDALSVFRQIPFIDIERIGLWGRSGGGAPMAAMLADQVTCTVLVSPGFKMAETFAATKGGLDKDGYIEMIPSYPHHSIKGYWKLKPEFFEELPALAEMMKEVAQRSRNVCVIQGDCDKTIPNWQDSEELLSYYQEPRSFVRIVGADHKYRGKKEEALSATLEWFNRFLCPHSQEGR
jgi:alpha/beta superfamily hydrolase